MDGSGIIGKGGHFKIAAQLQSLYYSFLLLCKAQGGGGKNLKLQKWQTKKLIEMEDSWNRHTKKDIEDKMRVGDHWWTQNTVFMLINTNQILNGKLPVIDMILNVFVLQLFYEELRGAISQEISVLKILLSPRTSVWEDTFGDSRHKASSQHEHQLNSITTKQRNPLMIWVLKFAISYTFVNCRKEKKVLDQQKLLSGVFMLCSY